MGGTVKKLTANPVRTLANIPSFGTYELARKALPGLAKPAENLGRMLTGQHRPDNPAIPGPFTLDPEQMAADQAAIEGLGEKQYQETIGAAPKIIQDTISGVLPGIAEDYNAGHLLNSTAYPQEVARQVSQMSKDLVLPAIQGRQGFQTGALQRGLSLEDFINQSNVAKTIGAQMAPQAPTGKQNFGTVAQGVGALAPWGKMAAGK